MEQTSRTPWMDLAPIKSVIAFIALLWIVFAFETVFPLRRYGIYPRHLDGLIGVAAAPFLHSNLQHLLGNTTGLLMTGIFCSLVEGRRLFGVAAGVTLLGGLLTWMFARPAIHIGASGLIFGLFGYLVFVGYFTRRWKFILASLLCLALFGSMIFGVLPRDPSISWESHLFGFLAGFLMAKWRS